MCSPFLVFFLNFVAKYVCILTLFFVGRLFDAHVLDMFELGIEKFKSMQEFHVSYSMIGCNLHTLTLTLTAEI